jgi:small neutral amino acid transporter SnatA (MarC family)
MPSISEIVTTFIAIFIVVDPFGIVPFFISLTAGFDARRRRRTILKAGAIASWCCSCSSSRETRCSAS